MRVALLVLAHGAPRALYAIAAHFAPADVDVYVHVDARIALAEYLDKTPPFPARVNFLSARRKVYWAGFSMVEATLDLLRAAARAGPYDRYLFISDNSLPVHGLDGFFAVLAAHQDMFEARRATAPIVRSWYEGFYLTDEDQFDCRRGPLAPRPVDAAMQHRLQGLLALKARGKTQGEVYHGQASWLLSADSAKLVLERAQNDSAWVESCRFALFSDEFFFSTIVAAAKYPGGLYDSPTYTDGFRFAPRVIAKPGDLPLDMQPHFLFLRKIAPDFSEDLPSICLNLYDGVRRLLAQDPGLRAGRVLDVSEGGLPHLHLFAPFEDDPDWGVRGNWKGRRHRNPLADSLRWRFRAPAAWPALRLSLPCVIPGGDALMKNAAFEIDGQRAPLEPCDIGYRADFRALARPFNEICLHLPGGARPRLAVAVMPEA